MTSRFLSMLAGLHGCIWNASEIGRGLGLGYHTVNRYLDFLEGTFLIRRLAPYSRNIGKRLARSPRVFWRDCGLLHSRWDLSSPEALRSHPQVGRSWEGFVIEQVLSFLSLKGLRWEASFLRTQDGRELDLVLEGEGLTWAIEVKASSQARSEDLAALQRKAGLIKAKKSILVTRQEGTHGGPDRWATDLRGLLEILAESAR